MFKCNSEWVELSFNRESIVEEIQEKENRGIMKKYGEIIKKKEIFIELLLYGNYRNG